MTGTTGTPGRPLPVWAAVVWLSRDGDAAVVRLTGLRWQPPEQPPAGDAHLGDAHLGDAHVGADPDDERGAAWAEHADVLSAGVPAAGPDAALRRVGVLLDRFPGCVVACVPLRHPGGDGGGCVAGVRGGARLVALPRGTGTPLTWRERAAFGSFLHARLVHSRGLHSRVRHGPRLTAPGAARPVGRRPVD